MLRRYRLPVAAIILAFAASACAVPTSNEGYAQMTPETGNPLLGNTTGGSLVANNAGNLVSNNAGSLRGTVMGPAAGLIANNAGNLVSNNAGSLVSNNAGSLAASVSAFVPRYGLLLAADSLYSPATQAQVALFDAQGNMLSDGWVNTDAQGGYSFSKVPSGGVLFVKAKYSEAGQSVTLSAFAAEPGASGQANVQVTPATTLVAKKLGVLIQTQHLSASSLHPEVALQMAQDLAGSMTAENVVAAAVLEGSAAADAFDKAAQKAPGLQDELQRLTAPTGGNSGASQPTTGTAVAAGGVSNLAGSGTPGFADGTGAQAQFNFPYAVAAAADGTLYVSDYKNQRIRKVTANGQVTTFAGSGATGSADGVGAAASFNNPRGIAVDAAGNLYVADAGNAEIRKIAPDGTVSTLAGKAGAGFADGGADKAQFNEPRGIAVDGAGNVYVADTGNLRIRKIDAKGVVSSLAEVPEPAGGTSSKLKGPYGVAVDGAGTVYVADATLNAIRKVNADGTLTTLAGGAQGFANGAGAAASFNGPAGLAIGADGKIYVADVFNHAIRVVAPDGTTSTLAGTGKAGVDNGPLASASFYGPYGLAVAAGGKLYVADTSNHRIRQVPLP